MQNPLTVSMRQTAADCALLIRAAEDNARLNPSAQAESIAANARQTWAGRQRAAEVIYLEGVLSLDSAQN